MARFQDYVLRDTRANQPAAASVAVGTLYCVTDESDLLERSTGAAWETFARATPSDASITTAKLADNSVTKAKLGDTVRLEMSAALKGLQGQGVYSGCVVTEDNAGAGLDVDVSAGHIAFQNLGVLVTAGEVTLASAHATLPRIDIVWVNTSGTLGKTDGTAATNPVAPAIPANSVLLASVYRAATDDVIQNADITDQRVRGYWPQIVRQTSTVTNTDHAGAFQATELTITLGASEDWAVEYVVIYDGNESATPDLEMEVTVPSGAVGTTAFIAPLPTTATGFSASLLNLALTNPTAANSQLGTVSTGFAGQSHLTSKIFVRNSTTPGNLTWNFRREGTSGTTEVHENSYIMAWPKVLP